ncbi:hypothetical protein [Pseudomonas fluorescens]|uniref:hypothetical protein n=1 Tax=Pseudomonas fluorescens TaxID=294 RepID=UPI001BEC370F|nr:hypothetical protein [Pseudomonas fluorescens]MBT2375479.1 hypothetical protein [Pseudomonas fluorescens]
MGDALLKQSFFFGMLIKRGEQQGFGFIGAGDLLQQLQSVFLFRCPGLLYVCGPESLHAGVAQRFGVAKAETVGD